MVDLSRLLGLAQKALDKTGSSTPDARGGGSDWRSVVRNAAEALTGDGAASASPPAPAGTSPAAAGTSPARPVPSTSTAAMSSARTPPSASLAGTSGAQTSPSASPAATSSAPVASTSEVGAGAAAAAADPGDRAAIARYDYLLQTADPHQIEQVHREAFERLTPAQRAQIDERMRAELPGHEQPRSSQPDDLARAATRTEMARPGLLRGLLARVGGAPRASAASAASVGRRAPGVRPGMRGAAGGALAGGAVAGAGLAAGGMLAAVAGGAVVSSVAGPLLEQATNLGVDFDALAGAIDLEALTDGVGGVEGLAGGVEGLTGGGVDGLAGGMDGLAGGVDELAAGAGETISGLGDQVPGLGDLFRR
ncbi:hypothetical protein [Herbiconiux ginsengi]|uniref:Cation-transporting ATPase n=1 Tax=Herbiconiux ginsengi TaxID=381665 RepID=A0A1H3KNX9_9MICO|nr:hypothetical protein [Herbiconiux ginsengi]SDY53831.1 hypothetical protein SAMN05216554_0637 [Herbiconiux ginsengi]